MTNQQILEKAIQKAIDGGWSPIADDFTVRGVVNIRFSLDDVLITLDFTVTSDGDTDECIRHLEKIDTVRLIFNHDFAKALWGQQTDTLIVQNNTLNVRQVIDMNGWRYHLQQMVIADDPIRYLEKNI